MTPMFPSILSPTGTARRLLRPLAATALATALAACSQVPLVRKPVPVYQQERFDASTPYAHAFTGTASATCEAARRALLSQGYVVALNADVVSGRKSFQPDAESHVQIEFNVVCANDTTVDGRAIAFVNAIQDKYAIKRTSNSASVGVGPVGSVSLPFSSSSDSLVKVASETIPAGEFYQRFFRLVEHFIQTAQDPGR